MTTGHDVDPTRAVRQGQVELGARLPRRSRSSTSRARTSSTTPPPPTCSPRSCSGSPASACSTTCGRACSSRSASRARPGRPRPEGIDVGGWGLSAPPPTSPAFGQLYLQGGVWQGRAARSRGLGRGRPRARQVPNGPLARTRTGSRATATSSGAAATAPTAATAPSASSASCCPSRSRPGDHQPASQTCRPSSTWSGSTCCRRWAPNPCRTTAPPSRRWPAPGLASAAAPGRAALSPLAAELSGRVFAVEENE